MTKLTESAIEEWALELLQAQGYGYFSGLEIAPDGERPLRTSLGDCVLEGPLQAGWIG